MAKGAWIAGVVLLAACARKQAPPDPCVPPTLTTAHAAGTYAGEAERTSICVKRAVYAASRRGGPVEGIGQMAVTQCGAEEKAEVAALAKGERVYPWETAQIHEKLQHFALLTARQIRSKGCGRSPGEPADDS